MLSSERVLSRLSSARACETGVPKINIFLFVPSVESMDSRGVEVPSRWKLSEKERVGVGVVG